MRTEIVLLISLAATISCRAAEIAQPVATGPDAKYVTCYQNRSAAVRSGVQRDDTDECRAVFKEIDDAQAAERRRIAH